MHTYVCDVYARMWWTPLPYFTLSWPTFSLQLLLEHPAVQRCHLTTAPWMPCVPSQRFSAVCVKLLSRTGAWAEVEM